MEPQKPKRKRKPKRVFDNSGLSKEEIKKIKAEYKLSKIEKHKDTYFHDCVECGKEFFGNLTTFRFRGEDGRIIKTVKGIAICSCCTAKHVKKKGVHAFVGA